MTKPRDILLGVAALAGAAACVYWLRANYPPDTDSQYAVVGLSPLLGLLLFAWGLLLLRVPLLLRRLAAVLFGLAPFMICLAGGLLLAGLALDYFSDCHRVRGVLSGVTLPCEVFSIPLALLGFVVGLVLAIAAYGVAYAWARSQYGIPIIEAAENPAQAPATLSPSPARNWTGRILVIILAIGVISAVTIPLLKGSYDQYVKKRAQVESAPNR